MTISTQAGLFQALQEADLQVYDKAAISSNRQGVWGNHCSSAGIPAPIATPATGAGTIHSTSIAGSPTIRTVPGGEKVYLAGLDVSSSIAPCTLMIVDILWRNSGMSGTTLTSQTVNSTTLTRYGSDTRTRAFFEVYTAIGTTSRTLTVTYTSADGTGSLAGTIAYSGSPRITAKQVRFMHPDQTSTKEGVQSIQSAIWDASTGTAGNFGMGICVPLASVYVPSVGDNFHFDWSKTGLIEISDTACLAIFSSAGSIATSTSALDTNNPSLSATMKIVYG